MGYLYHEGMPESRNGHCCTFDAGACGTMFGDGTGTVMMRPMSKHYPMGSDTVMAIVAGYGINNDGNMKVGQTRPATAARKKIYEER